MIEVQWLNAVMLIGIITLALIMLRLIFLRRQRNLRKRPDFSLMVADTDYYRKAMAFLLKEQGYKIIAMRVIKDPDPTEREPREILFALRRNKILYAALCVRWVVPVTSEVIARFEQALATTQANTGMIITTSIFTPAALARAQGLPVQLYDRDDLKKWIQ